MRAFLFFVAGLVGAMIVVPILIIVVRKYSDWLMDKFN